VGRFAAVLAAASLTLAGLSPAGAGALGARRLCSTYRCTTVAHDRSVRIVRVRSRRAEETEAELGHSVHWAIWRPTGRAWPLRDWAVVQDSDALRKLAVAGPWVGTAEESCSHETLECAEDVKRIDARTGQVEYDLPGFEEFPARECESVGTTTRGPQISSLVMVPSGTMAWIVQGRVCELPQRSQRPVLLSAGPGVAPHSLLVADGFLVWREGGALRDAVAA